MAAEFRDFLQRLIERGELRRVAEEVVAEPRYFYDVLSKFNTVPQRTIVQAWVLLREAGRLDREDRTGRYVIRN